MDAPKDDIKNTAEGQTCSFKFEVLWRHVQTIHKKKHLMQFFRWLENSFSSSLGSDMSLYSYAILLLLIT